MDVVFAFPGLLPFDKQAARRLLDGSADAEAAFSRCDSFVRRLCGWSLIDRIDSGIPGAPCHPSYVMMVAHQIALIEALRAMSVQPRATIGVSAGEPCAAYASGVLDAEDALLIAIRTGEALDSRRDVEGGLLALHAGREAWKELAGPDQDNIDLAMALADNLVILTGGAGALARLRRQAERRGVRVGVIPFLFAAHDRGMDPLRERLVAALRTVSPSTPRLPYMSSARGDWVRDAADAGVEHWWLHCRARVEFRRALEGVKAAGHRTLVEFGPRSVFSGLPRSDDLNVLRAQEMVDGAFA